MREFESSKLTIRLLYHATTAQVKTWLLRYCHLDSMKSTKKEGKDQGDSQLHIVLAQPTLHKIRRDFETRRHLPFLSYLLLIRLRLKTSFDYNIFKVVG